MTDKTLALAVLFAGATLSTAALAQDLTPEEQAQNNTVVLGETAEAPTEWLGETPHFVLVGEYGDFTFNVNLPDLAAAEAEVAGKREYGPTEDGGLALIDFEVAIDLVANAIERSFEFEFANADFKAFTLPVTLDLQADEEFPEGEEASLEVEFEWEWVERNVIVNDETLVESGTFTYALDQGEEDEQGVSDNGLVGGFFTAEIGGRTLTLSFTVPVAEAEIDD